MVAEVRYFTTANPPACSCKDWEYRGSRTGRPCKHIRALVEAETLLNANDAKWRGRNVDDCKEGVKGHASH